MSFQLRSRTQDKETTSEADTPKVKSEAASPGSHFFTYIWGGGYRLQSILTQISSVEVLSLN